MVPAILRVCHFDAGFRGWANSAVVCMIVSIMFGPAASGSAWFLGKASTQ